MSAVTSPREKVALQYPLDVDGVPVSALYLRPAKVRDRLTAEKMGKTAAEQEIALIALLADVTPDTVHELDMRDYGAVQQVLSGFF